MITTATGVLLCVFSHLVEVFSRLFLVLEIQGVNRVKQANTVPLQVALRNNRVLERSLSVKNAVVDYMKMKDRTPIIQGRFLQLFHRVMDKNMKAVGKGQIQKSERKIMEINGSRVTLEFYPTDLFAKNTGRKAMSQNAGVLTVSLQAITYVFFL